MPRGIPNKDKSAVSKKDIKKVKVIAKEINKLKTGVEVVNTSPIEDPLRSNMGRDNKGKFAPGHQIRAMHSTSSKLLRALGEEKAGKIIDMLWSAAEAGKMEALVFLAERLYPKESPTSYVEFAFERLDTIGDLDNEVKRVGEAIGRGEISLEAGDRLVDYLDRKRKFIFENKVQVMIDAMRVQNQNHIDISKVLELYH